MMGKYASRDKRPLNEVAIIDEETIIWISSQIPAASWGNIGGVLSNQTDLDSALSGKAAASHNKAGATVRYMRVI